MFIEPYLATVTIFAGNFAPRGWAFCDGSLQAIASNDALFALIGTTYGGDGQTTFALPDLRGRQAIHAGQGPGFTMHVLGEMAGTENVTLITPNLPAHSHVLVSLTGNPGATSATGTLSDPTGHVPATIPGESAYNAAGSGAVMGPVPATAVSPIAGGSTPIPIVSPYLAMNYIICVEGIFPSRN